MTKNTGTIHNNNNNIYYMSYSEKYATAYMNWKIYLFSRENPEFVM